MESMILTLSDKWRIKYRLVWSTGNRFSYGTRGIRLSDVMDYVHYIVREQICNNSTGVCPFQVVIIKDHGPGLDWRFSSPFFPTSARLNKVKLL